jgi:hypothetical protein
MLLQLPFGYQGRSKLAGISEYIRKLFFPDLESLQIIPAICDLQQIHTANGRSLLGDLLSSQAFIEAARRIVSEHPQDCPLVTLGVKRFRKATHQQSPHTVPFRGVEDVNGVELGVKVLDWFTDTAAADKSAYLPILNRYEYIVTCLIESGYPSLGTCVDVKTVEVGLGNEAEVCLPPRFHMHRCDIARVSSCRLSDRDRRHEVGGRLERAERVPCIKGMWSFQIYSRILYM